MSDFAEQLPDDLWSRWLLHDRHGGDPIHDEQVRGQVSIFVDRVLDGLSLEPGQTFLDLGTGDGTLGFRAIARVGPALDVVLSDISAPLLRHAEGEARRRGVGGQCRFIEASAESLDELADASVDAVGTRSVLAYVADRRQALKEVWRVLRPGGRISFAEPMMQDDAIQTIVLRQIVEARPKHPDHVRLELLHRWKSAQFPDTAEAMARNPLVNYSERDLLMLAQEAGFTDLHLELHIDTQRSAGIPWATFLATAPHPWAPTLADILEERFAPDERARLEGLVRARIEAGSEQSVLRMVYLSARKPCPSARPPLSFT